MTPAHNPGTGKTVATAPRPFPKILLMLAAATVLVANACAPANELRQRLLSLPLTTSLGGDTSRPLATLEAFTFVAANAGETTRASFAQGKVVFQQSWRPAGTGAADADGLGPVFNRTACSDCHLNNGRGRSPAGPDETPQSMLVRISVPGKRAEHGGPYAVPAYGKQMQDRAIADVPPEARVRVRWQESSKEFADGTPYQLRRPLIEISEPGFGPVPGNTFLSARVASPLIGLGLLEMIPAETLHELADPKDKDNDGISGRINVVFNPRDGGLDIGRFGWKANSANLASQNAAAARDDMGITSTLFPADNCPPEQLACTAAATHEGVEMSADALSVLTTYTRWLAVPRQRGANRAGVQSGFKMFIELGCGGCHMPTLVTGTDTGVPELSMQLIHPFTDLLLHDMGEGLADGRPDFLASGREWRTPPLWGIGLTATVSGHTEFLHDGRARSLQEAILWHGGEARRSRELFRSRNARQRSLLLDFLNSL